MLGGIKILLNESNILDEFEDLWKTLFQENHDEVNIVKKRLNEEK